MAPDPELLIEYARASAGFELTADQAQGIAGVFAKFERTFSELAPDELRDAPVPLEVVVGMPKQ